MTNDYSYGWEKLHLAVHCLAGHGDRRHRLADALLALDVLVVRPEDKYLPEEIQAEFIEFWKEMTSVAASGDEGTIAATVNSLDEMGIARAIERIISFYGTVCRYQEPLKGR
jgi:hypothetical protein